MEPHEDIDPPLLIAGLKQGQAQAWQRLCETYGQPLYLYAYHRCGRDSNAAEDIRQETLLAAVEAIGRYRGDIPLFGWLCGIARHKTADWYRRGNREQPLLESDRSDGYALERGLLWPSTGSTDLPERVVESEQSHAAIIEALWCLPTDHRQALIQRYLRGDSVAEIARLLNRSYKATESVLSRARQAVRSRVMELNQHVNE